MRLLTHIPFWLKNKYLLVIVGLTVWMLFFDAKDLVTQYSRTRELQKLEASKAYYQQQIAETQKELNLLKSNPSILEKYAREKYYMKRDNEDLFIIQENPAN